LVSSTTTGSTRSPSQWRSSLPQFWVGACRCRRVQHVEMMPCYAAGRTVTLFVPDACDRAHHTCTREVGHRMSGLRQVGGPQMPFVSRQNRDAIV
jgi:hypothetical protein